MGVWRIKREDYNTFTWCGHRFKCVPNFCQSPDDFDNTWHTTHLDICLLPIVIANKFVTNSEPLRIHNMTLGSLVLAGLNKELKSTLSHSLVFARGSETSVNYLDIDTIWLNATIHGSKLPPSLCGFIICHPLPRAQL